MLQILDHFQLLLDYLVEGPSLDGEQPVADDLCVLLADDGLETHPEGHSGDDFQEDATETPDVDDPRIVIFLDVLQQFGDVLELVLVEDEVEDLRGHVLRGSHGELPEIVEDEGTAVVYKFRLQDA